MIEATGRQSRQMVNVDERGFPRGRAKGASRVHGFRTGDLVKAIVPPPFKAKVCILDASWYARAAFLTYRPDMDETRIFRHATVPTCIKTMGTAISWERRFPRAAIWWKQEVEMGRRTYQSFVQIPHSRFIQMVQYKAQLVGLTVIVREESYTSKASFLDLDALPTYDPKRQEKPTFWGKRETRGLYRAKDGRRIQADVNGSYNILRKFFSHAFSESQAGPGQEIAG